MAMQQLSERVRTRLSQGRGTGVLTRSVRSSVVRAVLEPQSEQSPLVGTAALELAPSPLHEQIRQFAKEALATGYRKLQLLPLFLLPGVHVMEDIPEEVALAQQHLGDAIAISQQPHLGAHPEVGQLLTNQDAIARADAKILVSHGTRRPGGNEPVEVIAQQLGAVAAYWSISPNVEEQIEASVARGCKQLAILPYFIFTGGITDAIAQQVSQLQGQFPEVKLTLGNPIGASERLAELIVDLTEQP